MDEIRLKTEEKKTYSLKDFLDSVMSEFPTEWKIKSPTERVAYLTPGFFIVLTHDEKQLQRFDVTFDGKTLGWRVRSAVPLGPHIHAFWDRAVYGLFLRPAAINTDSDVSYLAALPKWVKEDIGMRCMAEGRSVDDVHEKIRSIPDINERFVAHSKWFAQIQRVLYYCSTNPDIRCNLPA